MASFPQSLLPTIQDGLQWMINSPEFIKDNLPSEASGGTKFLQETGRRVCRGYARARSALGGVAYAPVYSNLCTPYLDSINEGPVSDGTYGPEWTGAGGQCDGKLYGSSITFRTGFVNIDGGITWGSPQTTNASCGTPGVNLTGPVSFTQTTGGGGFINYSFQGKNNTIGSSVGSSGPLQILSTSLSLCSGQGTEAGCPLPPNVYKPPTFPPNLPPLSPPTNPAPGAGNNWDVNILPDGQVNICIGGECSTGTPPDGGGGPDSGGGPGEPDGEPQENDPNDPNDPQEISGCVEDGNLLTGLKIEITETPINSSGSNGINYRVAWIFMGPDSDKLDLVSDGRTLEDGQFVIPDSTDCTCYKVRMNLGWGLRVQAFSRPKEE